MRKVAYSYYFFCFNSPAFNWCLLFLFAFSLSCFFSLILLFLTTLFFTLEAFKPQCPQEKKIFFPLKLLIFILALFYGSLKNNEIKKEIGPCYGHCHFIIRDAKTKMLFGKKVTSYFGTIKRFITSDKIIENIPCYLSLKNHKLLDLDAEYIINDICLEKKTDKTTILKPIQTTTFIVQKKRKLSLVKARYHIKCSIQRHLKHHIKNDKVYHLLTALALGYTHNKTLIYEFSKLGLQHILAISGFHFGLISLFFGLILKRFFSLKITSIILLIILTLFMLYIGQSSSILRAYFSISLYLVGHLFGVRPKAINSLSLSCIGLLLYQPLMLFSLGFQLSYGATFGILTLFKPLNKMLHFLIKDRSLSETLVLSFSDKIIYLILFGFKKALALNIAVGMTTLPIIFYKINSYPLFSILYNMIIPFLVSISMVLLLSSCLTVFLPFFSFLLHKVNTLFTGFYLLFISYPPPILVQPLHLKLPLNLTIIFFTLSISTAIWFSYHDTLNPLKEVKALRQPL